MSRLEKLRALEKDLYNMMQKSNSRSIAPLAKQYRETLKEIEEIEGAVANDDDIAEILSDREAHGKAGAVR